MKDRESHWVANFAIFLPKTVIFLKKWMNCNYLQFLNYDNEIIQAEVLHFREFQMILYLSD